MANDSRMLISVASTIGRRLIPIARTSRPIRSTARATIPVYPRELTPPPEEDRRGASLKRRPYHVAAEQARRTEGRRRTRGDEQGAVPVPNAERAYALHTLVRCSVIASERLRPFRGLSALATDHALKTSSSSRL